jgi:hypothetical protein
MRSNKGSVLILCLRGPSPTTSAMGDKLSGAGYIFSILVSNNFQDSILLIEKCFVINENLLHIYV